MYRTLHRALPLLLSALWGTLPGPAAAARPATARDGMVATVHPLATDAGVAALRRGGNAVDAAVAAALMLGVVDGQNSGIGGGCLILIRRADGSLVAIDGRETAPMRATADMYVRRGKPRPKRSGTGPLAVATPGALAAYDDAVARFGRLRLADLLNRAADVAERGFPISGSTAAAIKRSAKDLSRFPPARALLLRPDGTPLAKGDCLVQPDLARTYRAVARHGTDWFYRGPFARHVGRWMARHGGILSAADFAAYRVRQREPIETSYRGHTIVGFPPPSSGGVHVAQMLNILEHFDLAQIHAQSPGQVDHLIAEAMKLAFADRAYWLGDPGYTGVPRGLIDKGYAAELARRIDAQRAGKVPRHGDPPDWRHDHFPGQRLWRQVTVHGDCPDFRGEGRENGTVPPGSEGDRHIFRPEMGRKMSQSPACERLRRQPDGQKHTTHIAAVDAQGNWVAITATINTSFGSKVLVPRTGVFLNNEMDDFAIAPGTPNAFGLWGADANAVAPGKRPLSSMSPTIVLRDGRPVMTLGAAGGPTIISQVVQIIVRRIDLKMPLAEAVVAPRIHHQWMPDELQVEKSLDASIVAALKDRGHSIKPTASIGVAQAIAYDPKSGLFIGVYDPRVAGKAAGP